MPVHEVEKKADFYNFHFDKKGEKGNFLMCVLSAQWS